MHTLDFQISSLIKKLTAFSAGLLLLLGMVSTPAQASSQCKGLSKTACSVKSSCGWTKGYKRSDGKSVNGYCRAASGKAKKSKTDKKAYKSTDNRKGKKELKNKASDKKKSAKKSSSKKKVKDKAKNKAKKAKKEAKKAKS